MARVDVSQYQTFGDITGRLDDIVAQVRDKDVSLERSLDLFDEAIALGSKAVSLVDATDFSPEEEARLAEDQASEAADEKDAQADAPRRASPRGTGTRVPRRRLDVELVEQGFFSTVDEALRAVMAGDVSTTDRRLTAPGEQVRPGIELHVRGRSRYVSRGGLKLERGLDHFSIDPAGLSCLDVGCSTGGFTDCLLKRGAASVISVDVGYAQFSWELRGDERVRLLERTNIVDVPALVGRGVVDLAVCDVSFTSVITVLPAVLELLRPGGTFLTLVKPQFEAAREDVGEGGVVRDASVRAAALERVRAAFEDAGMTVLGSCESPITGHKGNVEYLLCGRA